MRINTLNSIALQNVALFDASLDFFNLTGGMVLPTDFAKPAKFWRDNAIIWNPSYQNTYFDAFLGEQVPGYLVVATGKNGKPLLAAWEDQTTLHDTATTVRKVLPFIWHKYSANVTRVSFYTQYQANFPDGVPYLIPLSDHLLAMDLNPADVPLTGFNMIDAAAYRVPFPISAGYQTGDSFLRLNAAGKVEVIDIQEYIAVTPPPVVGGGGGSHPPTLTDQQLVSDVGPLFFSGLPISAIAAGIRKFAAL